MLVFNRWSKSKMADGYADVCVSGPPVRGTRGPLQRPAEPPLLDAPSLAHPHPLLPRQEALPVMLRTEEEVPGESLLTPALCIFFCICTFNDPPAMYL
ncbi:hypothetical protein NPIL_207521 [Nephila pilipes]|uniref:Uncharacterized protein n=1 Tax=Nephila pilipes TaxID=299642 RepID=A0A8X6R4G0_NEPPI|nr:hypothetical protein NPIL_207521 [Nephila pilipes]